MKVILPTYHVAQTRGLAKAEKKQNALQCKHENANSMRVHQGSHAECLSLFNRINRIMRTSIQNLQNSENIKNNSNKSNMVAGKIVVSR